MHDADWYAGLVAELAADHGWGRAVDVGAGADAAGVARLFADYAGAAAGPPPPGFVPTARRRWRPLDPYTQRELLPGADVLLCKDVLTGWPNAWVADWAGWLAGRLADGWWRHALLTFDANAGRAGVDCEPGGRRPLDPKKYPLAPALGGRGREVGRHGVKLAVLIAGG